MSVRDSLLEKLKAARLYLVTHPEKEGGRPLLATVEAALKGGVDIVQLRDYTLSDSKLLQTAIALRKMTLNYGALFIVNNRPDIARLSDADGVHVGQEDLPVRMARKIVGEEKLVGLSTQEAAQARGAVVQGADYIGVGPVFATPTKDKDPVGLGYVSEAFQMNLPIPFFAIGGVDLQNIESVMKAGGKRVSVVRALMDAADPTVAARKFVDILEKFRE